MIGMPYLPQLQTGLKMIIYYRISSNSYNKPRIPGATKSVCLKNFLEIFQEETIFLIKDNCDELAEKEIEKVLKDYPHIKTETTQLGNSGSFKYALSQAISHDPNEIIYFVEDDYLHKNNVGRTKNRRLCNSLRSS